MFHAVYERSLYEINAENLQLIQREILGIDNDEDILHKNYTLLCSHSDAAITQYVNHNINEYFEVVLHICGDTIRDDESAAIAILNNPNLTPEHKCSYISALKTTITFIKKITDSSLWSPLLDADIVLYSEQNIMDCFGTVKLSKNLISYINKCSIDLNFSKVENDENKEELFDSVVVCNDIENSKYKEILKSLNYCFKEFNISNISDEKIVILIDTHIIEMTAATLDFMRNNYSNQIFCFIRKNIEEYVEIMQAALLSQDELLEILSWDISDDLKIKLLEFSDDEISVLNKKYSTAIYLHILDHNFMESDLMDLFSSFEQWDNFVQAKIFDLAIKNISSIIDAPNLVSQKLKNDLFHSNKLSEGAKRKLLIAIIPDINEDYIKEILALLNLTEFLKIFEAHSRPKFEINDENENLLKALREKNIIFDYEEKSAKDGYYKIIRSKH